MIIVKIELHSAITGEITELGRMHISNAGGTVKRGDYKVQTFRGRSTDQLNRLVIQREGSVENHPRLQQHVWNLAAKALAAMGYGK